MIIYSSAKNYYLHQGALLFTLNALGDPNKVSVAVAANAAIMAYAKVDNTPIIDYDASLNYRTWRLQASPTHFDRSDKVYVYVRLSKTSDDAMVIFPYEKIPIDPALYDSGSSSSSSDDGTIDPNYYYIMLGALTAADNGGSTLVDRQWAAGEVLSYGELDTARYWEDESSTEVDKMFRLDNNNVIWTQHDLTFVNGAKLRLLRMSNFANNGTVDVTNIARAADITTFNFGANDTSIITTAGMAKYLQLFSGTLESKFLRKDQADSTPYKLTMAEAEVTGNICVGGNAEIAGDLSAGSASIGSDGAGHPILEVDKNNSNIIRVGGDIQSRNYTGGGMFAGTGWKIDQYGNADLESAKIRSFLEVVELLINRLQAQEGDTLFSDNDQIEEVVHESGSTYKLTLKEKWDGYITSQQVGNIIKGIINTLAAKEAGISDESATSVETDGENKYYTSWMQVTGTYNSTGGVLEKNQIRVVLYGDDYDDPVTGERVHVTPAGKNFPPCEMMNIARWGCYQDPNEQGISSAEKQSRIKRQQLFYISTTEGRIMKMTGVDSPILQEWNYGTTLGTIPDFIKNWTIASRLIDGRDYLYAQGVIVGDFIKVDIEGKPLIQHVDCGSWVDGSTMVEAPTPGHGIYLCNEYNATSLQWETHDVWHKGSKWRAKQHIPVNDGGLHYYEPTFNSEYWERIEGGSDFSGEFSFSDGKEFDRGAVDTTISFKLRCGAEDITDEIGAQYWSWQRLSDKRTDETIAADNEWNSQSAHQGTKTLHITNADIPAWWDTDNRIRFRVRISISDNQNLTFEL